MLGPYTFCIQGVLSNKFCFTFFLTVKKIKKGFFSKKNFLLDVNLKDVVKQKQVLRAILVGTEKCQPEITELKVGIHIARKKSLNHTFETQKSIFLFFQFRILSRVFLHAVSTYIANF